MKRLLMHRCSKKGRNPIRAWMRLQKIREEENNKKMGDKSNFHIMPLGYSNESLYKLLTQS